MKRVRLLLCLTTVALSFMSCKGEERDEVDSPASSELVDMAEGAGDMRGAEDMRVPGPDSRPELDMRPPPDMKTLEASVARAADVLRVMEPASIELALAGIGAETETTWSVESVSAPGVDCSRLIDASALDSVSLLLRGGEDPRCADELVVRAVVSDSASTHRLEHRVSVAPSAARVTGFVELAGNPQPDIQVCPAWDCLNHSDPTLGVLPTGELAIWFAAGGDYAQGVPVVGRAVADGAGGWVLDEAPVMSPDGWTESNWDRGRETPSVRWNDEVGAWDMWYLGYNEGYHIDPAIGQTRSMDADGTIWSRRAAPIYRPAEGSWDETFLTSPGAVLGSDGVWRLYYAGASTKIDAIGRIGVLTSTDGESWTPHDNNPVFEGQQGDWDANILDPHVQFVGGRYVMWYSALAGQYVGEVSISVGVAVSEDGYTWERLGSDPIISPQQTGWTSSRVLDVEVLERPDGALLMVGYAVSRESTNPAFPDFKPGRIGLWESRISP